MKSKFTIQIRRYSPEGKYRRTIKVSHGSAGRSKMTVDAWLATHQAYELECNMQTTPLNIMVRRDGKLISYKELM